VDQGVAKNWHMLPAEQVFDLIESNPERGLDTFEVGHRQEQYGPNQLTARTGPSNFKRFLLQFNQPLIYILIASGIITAVLQEWVDCSVIFGVVLVNAIVGYVQEAKAVQAMEALARTMTTEATVVRGGDTERVAAAQLVPGDVVLLQGGDKVPADLRLFRTRELQIDESALTGESVPVEKHPTTLEDDVVLAERANMAYASALVTYGTGAGVVISIGDATEVGRISQLISEADELDTPLTKKIAHFSFLLLIIILALGAITFVVGLLRGESVVDMFLAAVALAVGAIPEGLPAAVTITLAIGVARMARRKAVVRKLPAVETLGSTTVICTDKTGTLTQNQMTVQHIIAGGHEYRVTGGGYEPTGSIQLIDSDASSDGEAGPALQAILVAGVLCNDSQLVEQDGRWAIQGDPTEGALYTSAGKAGITKAEVEAQQPRLDTIPFESLHQHMATLNKAPDGGCPRMYMKGSVESVIERCVNALGPQGELVPLDTAQVMGDVERLAGKGLRVLAFAAGELPAYPQEFDHGDLAGMTFLGLQAMIDPPRPEAIAAVKACQTAGVRVKMITGDHAVTAGAIAREIGLVPPDAPPAALTGKQLEELTDDELIAAADEINVFARVSPEQKLRLVEALQSRGNIVAMTGDGVNDAPALKQADIGTAMGINGTDVAKEAADMVLTDDNFATIEAAVEEGRGVFDNIVKFITWTLPTNLGEGLVILAAVFAGTALPISPVQILWINMTTAVLLGLMLAFEPKEAGIMLRPPRRPSTPILTGDLIERILLVGALLLAGAFGLFWWADGRGYSIELSQTIAVNVFVSVELFYLFNCRSLTRSYFTLPQFNNRWVLGGVGIMILLQLAFTYIPFMNTAFGSAPLAAWMWLPIIGIGILAFFVVEIEKAITVRVRKLR
jgi:Ca2+-transporting ATPase